jgi:Leucine-rich repeat (LRR) protein
LDLTDNEKLRILYCSYNKSLEKLEINHLQVLETLHCEDCSLFLLNCDGLKNLKLLYCFNNTVIDAHGDTYRLADLSVRDCEKLEELDCAENCLEELLLINLPNLKIVSCKANKINGLIIDNCPEINRLNFADQGISY